MDELPQVQITAIGAKASIRLTSWQLAYATGGKPVVLGGQELPSQVGATLAGPTRILCVGPAEWLIVSREEAASSVREHFESDLARQGLVLVDLTDGLIVLEARGSAIRGVLSKGCGLDFHPRSFPVGRCARTRFAQIPLLVQCLDESPRFELTVARSYSQYLRSWLTDAAIEFKDQMMSGTTISESGSAYRP